MISIHHILRSNYFIWVSSVESYCNYFEPEPSVVWKQVELLQLGDKGDPTRGGHPDGQFDSQEAPVSGPPDRGSEKLEAKVGEVKVTFYLLMALQSLVCHLGIGTVDFV